MTWIENGLPSEQARQAQQALLRSAEALFDSGAWAWHLDSGRVVWSENLGRILEVGPRDEDADFSASLARTHPADRPALEEALARARYGEPVPAIRYRVITPRGAIKLVEATLATELSDTGGTILVGWLRDISETRRAEREISAHVAVTAALGVWDDFDPGAERLLGDLAGALEFDRGVLWAVRGGVLVPRVVWHLDDGEALSREVRDLRLRPGEGLAGRALLIKEPVVVSRVLQDSTYPFRSAAATHSLAGAMAIPAVNSQEVLAVIGLAGPDELELTDRLKATLTGIGHEVGAFLAHRVGDLKGAALSERELEVLQLAANGLSGPEIARHLTISPATIKSHFENIYAKYGVPDRVAAVAKALREGLIT